MSLVFDPDGQCLGHGDQVAFDNSLRGFSTSVIHIDEWIPPPLKDLLIWDNDRLKKEIKSLEAARDAYLSIIN